MINSNVIRRSFWCPFFWYIIRSYNQSASMPFDWYECDRITWSSGKSIKWKNDREFHFPYMQNDRTKYVKMVVFYPRKPRTRSNLTSYDINLPECRLVRDEIWAFFRTFILYEVDLPAKTRLSTSYDMNFDLWSHIKFVSVWFTQMTSSIKCCPKIGVLCQEW